MVYACADPESFVRGGTILTFYFCFIFFYEGEEWFKYRY